ncbi:MAG: asparaginase domain-containing protein [Bacteroidia bacterium]|nr:asparaginase domain-containing protein [Bacteroidia bacterium]
MNIRVFATGGTFDKEYDILSGQLFFKESHLQEMFVQGRCSINIDVRTLMMVDSLNMTDTDREVVIHNCLHADSDKIIITHGTDTMVKTASAIAKVIQDKTIVLTGAMIPYKFGSSDGFFNLGSALAFVQTLPKGVYIAMNGRYFVWNNVRKNLKTGFFEELENQ